MTMPYFNADLAAALRAMEASDKMTADEQARAAEACAAAAVGAGLPSGRRSGPIEESAEKAIVKTAKLLRSRRSFSALEVFLEQIETLGVRIPLLLQYHAQALVERGALLPAAGFIRMARDAASDAHDASIENELLSLEGRVYKQLSVNALKMVPPARRDVIDDYLKRSVAAYGLAWSRMKGTSGANFPGNNLLALSALARREGMQIDLPMPPEGIAALILEDVAKQEASGRAVPAWDYASAAEAKATRGDWEGALEMIQAYLRALKLAAEAEARQSGAEEAWLDAFAVSGTYRQFVEVWGANPDNPHQAAILDALRLAMTAGQAADIVLDSAQVSRLIAASALDVAADATGRPAGAAGRERLNPYLNYEKVWGLEGPMSLERLKQIINLSRCVARVVTATARSPSDTVGTGFLLAGASVHKQFADEVLFVTNSHVVSGDLRDRPACMPDDARICFDAGAIPRSDEIGLSQKSLLWTSPPTEHDAAIFRLPADGQHAGELAEAARLIKLAKGLPLLKQRVANGSGEARPTRVYVIGHPLGGELAFSMNDNELVDYENVYGVDPGIEPRLIHYMAPTQPGNSGSPVLNSRNLELIGLHHAGLERPRLNGKPGSYKVNEGLWIRPLLSAMLVDLGLGVWTPA